MSQGHSTKTDDLIVLGSDKLQNLTTFSEVMENNKGALICGLLEQSDYMLLHHMAALNGAKFISETTHTPADQRTRHTENSFLTLSVKKAFDQFVDVPYQPIRHGTFIIPCAWIEHDRSRCSAHEFCIESHS